MNLDLKIGDEVYDELLFPGDVGDVVDIEPYLIAVKFRKETRENFYLYKIDGDESNNHWPPQLSRTPYQIVGLTPICRKDQ